MAPEDPPREDDTMAERHDGPVMLLDGVHHIALLTSDTERGMG